jgi:NSS family neurotransmitter:Na+ symporter
MAFKHEIWSSRTTFLMAAVGAAVGLGNIWRFPYMTGTNGGGAFVLIYLSAVVLIAIPVLISETMIGRHGHMSAPVSMQKAAADVGASRNWGIVGWFGVAAAFLILQCHRRLGHRLHSKNHVRFFCGHGCRSS